MKSSRGWSAALLVVVVVVAAVAGKMSRGSRKTTAVTADGGELATLLRGAPLDARLVPVARARVLFENRRIEASPDPLHALVPAPPHDEITPALWAALAYRTRDGLEPLGADELANLAGPFDAVWPVVLARFASEPRDAPVLGESGVYELAAADGNAAARLLVPSTFSALALQGDAVVALPRESLLLVADAARDASLDALSDRLKQLWEEGPCDSRAFRVARRGGAVTPFTLPASASRASVARDLESAADQYDATRQREALERKLGSGDDVPFIASVKRLRSSQTEEEIAFVVQTEEVPTLITPAAWVDFRRVDMNEHTATTLGCATWDAARALLGTRWRETPLWPPRYETTGFPTGDELAKMGCAQPALAIDVGVARSTAP